MKIRGFTLVELLGVIVIISLILTIALPLLTDSVRNHEDELNNLTEDVIINSAKLFIENNNDEYVNKTGAIYCIPLTTLRDGEYLKDVKSSNIIDKKTVKVSSKKDFTYEIVDNDKCSENIYPSKPNLRDNSLVPVKYIDLSWKVVDENSNWYDYEKQEWANAVLLKEGVSKGIGDIINIDSEAQAMFVWIPRFEYKIEGQYGTHTYGTIGTKELPGEIEVQFITKSKITATPGYIIHPAFNFGGKELDGIWVGKFETTGTGDNPTILPSVVALTYQNISAQFATAQKIKISGYDSHMSKNSEWVAAAYLSQSKYGKYGNSKYTSESRKVAHNVCTERKTGVATCSDLYTSDAGQATSTTGNITGVYDMSGGEAEYVMGILNKTIRNSGFTALPDSKYFDNYTTTDKLTACNGHICYGHALSEVSGWYSDYGYFVSSSEPWFHRGGYYYNDPYAGVFTTSTYHGGPTLDIGFRVVLSPI